MFVSPQSDPFSLTRLCRTFSASERQRSAILRLPEARCFALFHAFPSHLEYDRIESVLRPLCVRACLEINSQRSPRARRSRSSQESKGRSEKERRNLIQPSLRGKIQIRSRYLLLPVLRSNPLTWPPYLCVLFPAGQAINASPKIEGVNGDPTDLPLPLVAPRVPGPRNTEGCPRQRFRSWRSSVGSIAAFSFCSRGRGRRRSYRAEVARPTRGKIRSPSFRTRPTTHADSPPTGVARNCADTRHHPTTRSHPPPPQGFFILVNSLSLLFLFVVSFFFLPLARVTQKLLAWDRKVAGTTLSEACVDWFPRGQLERLGRTFGVILIGLLFSGGA